MGKSCQPNACNVIALFAGSCGTFELRALLKFSRARGCPWAHHRFLTRSAVEVLALALGDSGVEVRSEPKFLALCPDRDAQTLIFFQEGLAFAFCEAVATRTSWKFERKDASGQAGHSWQ